MFATFAWILSRSIFLVQPTHPKLMVEVVQKTLLKWRLVFLLQFIHLKSKTMSSTRIFMLKFGKNIVVSSIEKKSRHVLFSSIVYYRHINIGAKNIINIILLMLQTTTGQAIPVICGLNTGQHSKFFHNTVYNFFELWPSKHYLIKIVLKPSYVFN